MSQNVPARIRTVALNHPCSFFTGSVYKCTPAVSTVHITAKGRLSWLQFFTVYPCSGVKCINLLVFSVRDSSLTTLKYHVKFTLLVFSVRDSSLTTLKYHVKFTVLVFSVRDSSLTTLEYHVKFTHLQNPDAHCCRNLSRDCPVSPICSCGCWTAPSAGFQSCKERYRRLLSLSLVVEPAGVPVVHSTCLACLYFLYKTWVWLSYIMFFFTWGFKMTCRYKRCTKH